MKTDYTLEEEKQYSAQLRELFKQSISQKIRDINLSKVKPILFWGAYSYSGECCEAVGLSEGYEHMLLQKQPNGLFVLEGIVLASVYPFLQRKGFYRLILGERPEEELIQIYLHNPRSASVRREVVSPTKEILVAYK